MRYIFPSLFVALFVFVVGFRPKGSNKNVNEINVVTAHSSDLKTIEQEPIKAVEMIEHPASNENDRSNVQAESFVEYAKTLIGTPYVYGSVDPARGLDCSGFVNCVSDHFGIDVPRSSVEFTNLGTTIETDNARPGDLILFTGTNPHKNIVGHIGIVTDNQNGEIEFIHSTSGKAKGVIVSDLSDHYKTRLVKVIRIFPIEANKVVG
jgi:cell wall-associated NlpC family hydrolase